MTRTGSNGSLGQFSWELTSRRRLLGRRRRLLGRRRSGRFGRRGRRLLQRASDAVGCPRPLTLGFARLGLDLALRIHMDIEIVTR
jgi:hypothetical protein